MLPKGIDIVLPQEITLADAIKINVGSMRREGIEEIKDNGDVILTEEATEIGKELYGMELREFRFADMEDLAGEMLVAFSKAVEKYKI